MEIRVQLLKMKQERGGNQMKKTLVLIVALAMLLSLAVVGCSDTPGGETTTTTAPTTTSASDETEAPGDETTAPEDTNGDGEVTIGMSIPQLANPYFVSVMNGVQARCDELGWELTVVDAGYDVAKQVSDFENFGNQGVDAVIACPIDSNALVQVVDQLQEKGIMVVSFAQIIDNANAIHTLDEYTYGVAIGENAAKWINEKLDGKAQVLIISQDNVEAVVQRGNGIQDTIEKLCPDAEIVARQAGDNPEKGMEITENIMQQYPDVKVITGNNDAGPLGAYEAVLGMGKASDDFYIGGGDATPEAIEKMKEPNSIYRATVDLAPYVTGMNTVDSVLDMITNGIPDEAPVTYFPMDPVWQEDALAGWAPKG